MSLKFIFFIVFVVGVVCIPLRGEERMWLRKLQQHTSSAVPLELQCPNLIVNPQESALTCDSEGYVVEISLPVPVCAKQHLFYCNLLKNETAIYIIQRQYL